MQDIVDRVAAYIERGNTARRGGDFATAIAAYSEALGLAPDFMEVLFFRGMCFYHSGDFKRGAADFDKVVRLSPDRLPPRYWRGLCYHAGGEHDAALVDFNEVIRREPDFHHAYWLRGNIYGDRGDFRGSIREYTTALRCDPAMWIPLLIEACPISPSRTMPTPSRITLQRFDSILGNPKSSIIAPPHTFLLAMMSVPKRTMPRRSDSKDWKRNELNHAFRGHARACRGHPRVS